MLSGWVCWRERDGVRKMPNGSFFETEPSLELYYEARGEGPPLVFVPGWTFTTEVFDHQVTHFSKTRQVVSFDPRQQTPLPTSARRPLQAVIQNRAPDTTDGAQFGAFKLQSAASRRRTANLWRRRGMRFPFLAGRRRASAARPAERKQGKPAPPTVYWAGQRAGAAGMSHPRVISGWSVACRYSSAPG